MVKQKMHFKWIVGQLLCLLFLSLGICFILYKDISHVKKISTDSEAMFAEQGFNYSIDYLEDSGDEIIVQGWAFIEGKSTQYFDCSVVLKNLSSNDYYQIPTSYQERKDVTEVYGSQDLNYDHSGFFARVLKDKLPTGEYEVYLGYNAHTILQLYQTGYFIGI